MIETIAITAALVSLACFALCLYGALLFRRTFGLVGILWAVAVPYVNTITGIIGTYIGFTYIGTGGIPGLIDRKMESSTGVPGADALIYIMAFQALIKDLGFLLLVLVVLSDLAHLLEEKGVGRPKLFPLWSNRTIHIVGSLALVGYLLSHWMPILWLLLPEQAS